VENRSGLHTGARPPTDDLVHADGPAIRGSGADPVLHGVGRGLPVPLAVLDSPDWRAWHLRFESEHRSFTVVYIDEDDAQLKLTTDAYLAK
jgi:hypothetical protein